MDVLAVSLAVAATVFPWACGEHKPVVTVRFEPLPGGLVGWANPAQGCVILLDPKWRRLKPNEQCRTVAHEMSHLAGLSHSTNPRSIRYPTPSVRRPYPRCVRALRRARTVR